MKISAIAKLWNEDKKRYVKQSTSSAYYLLLQNHILPHFGERETLTEDEVQEWVYEKNDKGLSRKSIQDSLIVLKMVLKFGAKKNLFDFKNDFEIKYPPKKNVSEIKHEPETMPKAHFNKLSEYLINNFSFQNLGILIAMHTGMRIGEICALKWKDVDIDNAVFIVNKTRQRIYFLNEQTGKMQTKILDDSAKTVHSNREIPIPKKLLKIIKQLKKIVNDDFFVITNTINGTEPRTYRNYFLNILDLTEITRIKFHGMRHTFATMCLAGGADIKTTSTILGHSKVGITMDLYMHPDKEEKRKAIDKIFK